MAKGKLPSYRAFYSVSLKQNFNPKKWWFCNCSISSIFFTLCLVSRFQMILTARSTDELDNGYRFAGESSNWDHHWNYSSGKETYEITPITSSSSSSTGSTTTDVDLSTVLKYWGCYRYWTGGEYNHKEMYETAPGLEMNAEKCVKLCQTKYEQEYQVAMVKGVYCSCVLWEHFKKARIEEKFCNFFCPQPSSSSISILGMEGKEQCGGNLGVSVYCNFSQSVKCTEINWDEMETNSTEENATATTTAVGIFNEADQFGPQIIQACAYCNVTIGGIPSCGVVGGTNRKQDYFPLNNPQDCINNCKNVIDEHQMVQAYNVAILHWIILKNASGVDKLPVCRCEHENPIKKPGWYPVSQNTCSPCPADNSSMCGSSSQPDFHDYFTVYCVISGAECEFEEQDEEEGGEDYHTNYNNSSYSPDSPTNSTITTESTTTTTMTTLTSTIQTTTADTTTTQSPSIPTTNGVVIVPISTTTTTPPSTSKPTTTPSPPLIDCRIQCEGTDHYNQTWKACARQIQEKICPDGKSGTARWKCLITGHFETSSPNFSNCTTDWYDDLYQKINDTIAKNKTLTTGESEDFLKKMEIQCTVHDTNKIPYFGHEIRNIAAASSQIVNLTNATLEDRKRLLTKAINMPGLLLKNKEPWREMNLTERAIAGREIIQSIELSMFTLSQNVDPDNPIFNYTPRTDALNKTDFHATFGARCKSASNQSSLTFPIDATPKGSFIELSEGWEDLVSTPQFVGISIHPRFIQNILSPRLSSSLVEKENSTSKRLINGNLLSLSIKGLDSKTTMKLNNLKGKKVRITFEHEVEAWGNKIRDVPRKLHEGETPKVAIGSAVCVYWNTEKLEWSKDGCRLIESTKTHTVCECTHLTSFAVLMDTHNYVGKDFVLEIMTLILSPLSVICLLVCIIVFSTVAAIQSQRTTITKHLSICLLLGNVAILFVVDRHYFHLPDGICIGVGIVTHYILLAAFCWMQIEGIHLYKMVVFVFESGRSHTTIYRIMAYGIPVLFVGITCVVGFLLDQQPYGGFYCWLDGPYIWSFAGPVALIIMANMIILFVALKTAYQMKAATANIQTRQRSYRTWIRGSFSITIILGITWIPGFFVTTGSVTAATVAAYVFVILNASQGIFLFVFHCFMNEKVRMVAERNLSLPSWLSIPSNPSKEVTQSGKRSDVMRGMYSETSKSFKKYEPESDKRRNGTSHNMNNGSNGSISSIFNPDFNPYPGFSKDPNYSIKGHGSIDSELNESRTSSQKSLVHVKRKQGSHK